MVEAFAVRSNQFLLVGSNQAISEVVEDGTKVVDLKGATVIPGMIDGHAHFARGGALWSYGSRFDGLDSREAALQFVSLLCIHDLLCSFLQGFFSFRILHSVCINLFLS